MIFKTYKNLFNRILNIHYVYTGGNSGGGGGTTTEEEEWSSGMDTNSPGFGSPDWEPSADELTRLTGDQIAGGFGLDPDDFGQYFSTFEGWKGAFADRQYEADVANIIAKGELDRAEGQAQLKNLGNQLGTDLSENIIASSNAYADTMAAQIDAQATGLMGGASTRSARTAGQRMKEQSDTSGQRTTQAYGAAAEAEQRKLEFLGGYDPITGEYTGQMGRDIAQADLSRDYDQRNEIEQFKSEIYDTLDMLGSTGALETADYTPADWVTDIVNADGRYEPGDFTDEMRNASNADGSFLEWFHKHMGSHDTDWFQNSAGEVNDAYEAWKAGDDPGTEGDTCVLSTAAFRQGLISSDELMSFVNWRLRTQHKEFLSGVKWLGYQIAWKPVARKMDRDKDFAKFIKRVILDKWLGIIQRGEKHRITKFFVEWVGVLGFVLNYRKAMKLKEKIYANPKAILQSYKNLIRGK